MNEDKIRMELQRSMMFAGLDYYHPTDIRQTETARPDILSINGAVIEVKKIDKTTRIEPWFDPKKISNGQRKHLDYYCFGRVFQTYLAIGTTFGNPRKLWVIPWTSWVNLEYKLLKTTNPNYIINEYRIIDTKIKIKISSLEIMTEYELSWAGAGVWKFPKSHPILSISKPRHGFEWNTISLRFMDE